MLRKTYVLIGMLLVSAGVIGCSKSKMSKDVSFDRNNAATSRFAPLHGLAPDEGIGPDQGGDKYDKIVENPFIAVASHPLSTFSTDVDTASYSKLRMYLMQQNMLPPPDAVRIEELVNYFDYNYTPPADGSPFAAHIVAYSCPWNSKHRLARIGIKGRVVEVEKRPSSNLVFLLDVSGSMSSPNKLPLLKQAMRLLVGQLTENDRVAIVVYAGAAGTVLPSTPGNEKAKILDSLMQLESGGSTHGSQGIKLAYQLAQDNFIPNGVNRVVLCSDGDFNVGTTSTSELVRLVEGQARQNISLSVLGFGMGNHNDAMMEQISNKGDGNYAFIDSLSEARKVLVAQISGTLVTIAKDVKIQVEFNPQHVSAYRLIGYENRLLADEDFNDDQKDAGDIGAGHTVTALYELIPVGVESNVKVRRVDTLKYQDTGKLTPAAKGNEMLTVSIRYKQPQADKSKKIVFAYTDKGKKFAASDLDFQFASAVAAYGMLLRDSQYKGDASFDAVLEIGTSAVGDDLHGYRREFLELVRRSKTLQ